MQSDTSLICFIESGDSLDRLVPRRQVRRRLEPSALGVGRGSPSRSLSRSARRPRLLVAQELVTPTRTMATRGSWLVVLLHMSFVAVQSSVYHGHKVDHSSRPPQLVLSTLPSTSIADSEVPRNFDWRNIEGRSMVTADVNQHVPVYCGSCWIHGTLAMLNDRIKVARNAAFPDVMLSRQAAMNCVHDYQRPDAAAPGCDGGDPMSILLHMTRSPLPDESCQPYEARNGVCDAAGQCRNCFHPEMLATPGVPMPPAGFTSPGCFAVSAGVRYGVREYGTVSGELRMQKEIVSRGPIVCSLAADLTFLLSYREHLIDGEVYVDPSYFPDDGSPSPHNASEIDHDVELTGWGVTSTGVPYWVARNSWGTYWGERGWFKILRGSNHLFIEEDCQWAVPQLADLEDSLATSKIGDYVTGEQREAQGAAPPARMPRVGVHVKLPSVTAPSSSAADAGGGAAAGSARVAKATLTWLTTSASAPDERRADLTAGVTRDAEGGWRRTGIAADVSAGSPFAVSATLAGIAALATVAVAAREVWQRRTSSERQRAESLLANDYERR